MGELGLRTARSGKVPVTYHAYLAGGGGGGGGGGGDSLTHQALNV